MVKISAHRIQYKSLNPDQIIIYWCGKCKRFITEDELYTPSCYRDDLIPKHLGGSV